MTLLDPGTTNQLRVHLQKLQLPLELAVSLDDSDASRQLQQLLQEIAALSPLIRFVHVDEPVRRPTVRVRRVGTETEVSFAGAPLGHEFSSLVLALLQVGGHPPRIAEDLADRVRALTGELRFETYYSTSCQNCPDVVQALNAMSVLNPEIRHTAIDGAAFAREVEERQVMAVPTVFLNGEVFAHGRMDLAQLLRRLEQRSSGATSVTRRPHEPFDVLIVGGGPAGAAAAIYAARKGIRTGIVAERLGGQVLDTMAIENFISVRHTEGPRFAAALEEHARDYDVDVIAGEQVTQLVPASSASGLHEIRLADGQALSARALVLAPGARWRTLNVPGEEKYRNSGVAFCPHCDGPLFKGKRIAVIGGGNSGVEAAIDLAGIAAHVTLLEFDSQLRADELLQRKLRSLPNVAMHLHAETVEVLGDDQRVTGLAWRHRDSGHQATLPVDGIFVQIGLIPNTDWLGTTLARTPRGEIMVDDRGRTSVPGVFAAGDATTAPYKQIVIAMGSGATAALSAFDHLVRTAAPAGAVAPLNAAA